MLHLISPALKITVRTAEQSADDHADGVDIPVDDWAVEDYPIVEYADGFGQWNRPGTGYLPASIVDTAFLLLTGRSTQFYAEEPSDTDPDAHTWYTSSYTNPYTGDVELQSAHLTGFSDRQARLIFEQVQRMPRGQLYRDRQRRDAAARDRAAEPAARPVLPAASLPVAVPVEVAPPVPVADTTDSVKPGDTHTVRVSVTRPGHALVTGPGFAGVITRDPVKPNGFDVLAGDDPGTRVGRAGSYKLGALRLAKHYGVTTVDVVTTQG